MFESKKDLLYPKVTIPFYFYLYSNYDPATFTICSLGFVIEIRKLKIYSNTPMPQRSLGYYKILITKGLFAMSQKT